MSMSQLPDSQYLIELEIHKYKHWYNRMLLLIAVGIVFVCVPFITAYLWIREKRKR